MRQSKICGRRIINKDDVIRNCPLLILRILNNRINRILNNSRVLASAFIAESDCSILLTALCEISYKLVESPISRSFRYRSRYRELGRDQKTVGPGQRLVGPHIWTQSRFHCRFESRDRQVMSRSASVLHALLWKASTMPGCSPGKCFPFIRADR
jgi:hypothetical protein